MMDTPYQYQTPKPGTEPQEDDPQADVQRWQQHAMTAPEDRENQWIAENLWPKGLSADKQTREIIGPDGQVVGQLPDFN